MPAGDAGQVSAIARAWDTHVRFGVEHPAFYAHIYARVEPGYRCGVVSVVERMLLESLERSRSRLSIAPEQAAQMILAASTGVILTLISEMDSEPNWELSERVRDAVLDAITVAGGAQEGGDQGVR